MQNKGDVVERCGRVHEHLGKRARDHAEHFTIARIGDGFHIADHADNRKPRTSAVESSPADALANRRIVRPKTFCNALTDDANQRRVGRVALY